MAQTFLFLIIGCFLTVTQCAPKPNCDQLPGSPLDAVSCCGFPDVELDSATMTCIHEVNWDSTSLMAACTLHECHATKSKIIQGNEMNKTALMGYVADIFKEFPEWVDVTSKAFDTCLENIMGKQSDLIETYSKTGFDVKACNPTSMSIETCSFLHVFNNCPSTAWIENDHCNEWKTYAQNCAFDPNAVIKLNDVSMDDLKEEIFV